MPGAASAEESRSIAVLDFEIEDDLVAQGGASDAGQEERLRAVRAAVQQELARSGALRSVDDAPARELIDTLRASQALHTCNGCEVDIGRVLGADLVAVGWVQKVSSLILNLNLGVKDVATGRTLVIRSVDLRGNTEVSWLRGARRLAEQIETALAERR